MRQLIAGSLSCTILTNISSLEQSVRDDLAVIKGSPLMRKELADHSYGFIYDIKTGLVSAVKD